MSHLVFVFGTLKQGFPNFSVNRGTRMAGGFCTRESYPLYLVGERHTPWVIDQPGFGSPVHGQVFEVDDETLAAMDRLERVHEPDGYRRVPMLVQPADGGNAPSLEAYAYLKPADQLDPAEVRAGPFAEYTLAHASLYRARR